ncbi:MAG: hypothetical protein IKP29_08445 [Pseudobutyrivibrio sp.]|nr:hypothetical protein [Pseudobutyrivibrio sp.]
MVSRRIQSISIADLGSKVTVSVIADVGQQKIELPAERASLSTEELSLVKAKYGQNVFPLDDVINKWQEKIKAAKIKGKIGKLDFLVITSFGVFRWEDIKLYKFKLESGRLVYVVVAAEELGERYNRRRGIRIGIDKVMDVEQMDNMYSVIVKDISYCGVAILEPMGAQIDPDDYFLLHLIDYDQDGQTHPVAEITAKIANQKVNEDGSVFSGCSILADHASFLQQYIANKQIEELRAKNSN